MWRWLTERICGRSTSTAPISAQSKALLQASGGETRVLYARVRGHLPVAPNPSRVDAPSAKTTKTPKPTISAASPALDSSKKHVKAKGTGKATRRRTRAHRFSAIFSDMTPREAKLLFCVHRRSLRQLASESPAALRRDLQRFVLSSRGRAISRDRPAPTLVRVRRWVSEAKSLLGESAADIKPRPLKLAR